MKMNKSIRKSVRIEDMRFLGQDQRCSKPIGAEKTED